MSAETRKHRDMEIDQVMMIFIFIAGLLFGSFFNVVIYRVPGKISVVKPDSMCPACGKPLKWYDMFPVVSYLLLGRKCRYCKTRISPRYALVELLTAAITLLLYIRYGMSFEFIFYLSLVYVLLPCFFIDLEHMIIPNGLIITGLAIFTSAFIYRLISAKSILLDNIYGGLAGGGIMLLIYIIGYMIYKKEALGFGDVKLFFMSGLFLGLKLTVIAFLFSIFSGALAGIIFMIATKKDSKTEIPFGPFLAFSSVLALFAGELVYDWYAGLFL
jgi:leader peptidase (prepilin peptidase) / N-methyltransferase